MMVYDPNKGNSIKERLDLKGNPSVKDDWYTIRKTKETMTLLLLLSLKAGFVNTLIRMEIRQESCY